MMPVASTDCVSRYTQKVRANHRKLVVTFASAVFTSTWMNVRMPPGGGRPGARAPDARLVDPPLTAAVRPSWSPGEVMCEGTQRLPTRGTPSAADRPPHRRTGADAAAVGLRTVTTLHDTDLRGFASDNYSGIHPEVLAAIAAANDGHQVAYGEDEYTARLQEVFAHHFGEGVEAFPVFNGTGANVVGLQSMLPRWGAVIAASTAHINVDEGGAPERVAGIKILTVPTDDGKLTPELIDREAWGWGDEHRAQPLVVSITQSTELGTLYSRRRAPRDRRPRARPRHAAAHGRRAHLERRGIPRPAAARVHARRRASTC